MKARTGSKHDKAGDCITHPEHGAAFALNNGLLWCAHQSHDRAEGGTPWLNLQEEAMKINSPADCPHCLAGTPGRHQDKGGLHDGPTPKIEVVVTAVAEEVTA